MQEKTDIFVQNVCVMSEIMSTRIKRKMILRVWSVKCIVVETTNMKCSLIQRLVSSSSVDNHADKHTGDTYMVSHSIVAHSKLLASGIKTFTILQAIRKKRCKRFYGFLE